MKFLKQVFWASCVFVGISFLSWNTPAFAAEEKQVCHDRVGKDGKPVMDKKTGKPVQDCKTIKVHKKLEGTEVPVKK
jgi:hypothetical protein